MEKLQKAAKEVASSTCDEDKRDSLSKAFAIFSDQTVRLEKAYDSLNEQFQSLNLELQEANHKLHGKVAELDIITDYLRSILDNIAQGILFVDLKGTITTYNRAAEAILGIPARQAVFHSFWTHFPDDVFGFSMHEALDKHVTAANYSASYTTPEGLHCDLEVITAFALKGDVVSGPNGKIQSTPYHTQGMIVMIRDVTEMRHLQTQAARADRMKILGEMAAQVAHEIRNPLGGIKGFASLLMRDLTDNPPLHQMASYIVEGTDNLNRLVSQVLSFARPVQPHMERTDLVAMAHEVRDHILADASMNAQNIVIDIDACSKKLFLSIDAALFKSALLNLLVNAVQAMPEGGEVLVSIRENPKNVIISISDTGTGISEENMAKLYNPFFTTKQEGNGLGLVEVQKVVQAHGGTIDVSSTLEKGTTFVIKLPKLKAAVS